MRIIDTPECNLTLAPPSDWDDARNGPCEPARAERDRTGFVVTFEFEPEEFAALLRGGRVKLKIFGGAFPPVSVWISE